MSSERPDHTWFLPEHVDPDWQARRDLGDALRALSEACVGTQADRETLQAATSLVRDATQLLPDGRTAAQAFTDGSYMDNPGLWIDRGALMGWCNPVAPPMRIRFEEGRSHCTVRLGQRHVGAPGMVHGGILAACFDQVSGHCAVVSGHPGLTVSLHVQYQGPAHVDVDLQFVAELEQVAGREITVGATCSRQGEQIASCRAIFVTLNEEQGQTLFHGA